MADLARVVTLNLLIPVVIHEVYHVGVNVSKLGTAPAQRLHVHETIQVEEAEGDRDPVEWRNLNLVLSVPWQLHSRHSLNEVDPSLAGLAKFVHIESIAAGVKYVLAFTVVFLPSLGSENDRLLSLSNRPTGNLRFAAVAPRVCVFVFKRIFNFQRFTYASIDEVVVEEGNLEQTVDSDSLLISKLSLCNNCLCIFNRQKVSVDGRKISFHTAAHVVEKLLDAAVPRPVDPLKSWQEVHPHELNQQQENRVVKVDASEPLLAAWE